MFVVLSWCPIGLDNQLENDNVVTSLLYRE